MKRRRLVSIALATALALALTMGIVLKPLWSPVSQVHASGLGSWTVTGSMTAQRYYFQMVLLQTGKVLAIGGFSVIGQGIGPVASAELYDPSTGQWTPTGSMQLARAAFTATVLPNGHVLVAGGQCNCGSNGDTATAELYDPATGTWSPTGSMAITRVNHVAVLLSDGNVLVAGGYNGNNTDNTAEVYDAATDTWAVTGSMATPRYQPAASLLEDGTVLVTGGRSDTQGLATTEIYHPNTHAWTSGKAMNVTHDLHTMNVLQDGEVLVAGGESDDSLDNLSAVTEYIGAKAKGKWRLASPMAQERLEATGTLLSNGEVLEAGTDCALNPPLCDQSTAELYMPNNRTWAAAASMNQGRACHAAVLLPSGQVLVAGGFYDTIGVNGSVNNVPLASAELYTP